MEKGRPEAVLGVAPALFGGCSLFSRTKCQCAHTTSIEDFESGSELRENDAPCGKVLLDRQLSPTSPLSVPAQGLSDLGERWWRTAMD